MTVTDPKQPPENVAMKTYPLLNDADKMIGFEISNLFFPSSASVARFFAKCPGVQITRQRKMFESGNEIHAEFVFQGTSFIVWEPFGDNSRYWVGLKDESDLESDIESDSLRSLQDFVSSSWPGPISRVLGFVLPWHH